MAKSIYPSDTKAVGGIGVWETLPTNQMREFQIAEYMNLRGKSPLTAFVSSGFTISAGTGLAINIAAGTAIINGYVITNSAIEAKSGLTDSIKNYIYAQLTLEVPAVGGHVIATGYTIVANVTAIQPSDSVCIGTATCNAGSVTSVENSIANPRIVVGNFTGDGTGETGHEQAIFLGFEPKFIFIYGPLSGSGYRIAYSGTEGLYCSFSPIVFGLSTESHLVPVILSYGFKTDGNMNLYPSVFYYHAFA